MKKLVAAGFLLVAVVELIALASPDRRSCCSSVGRRGRRACCSRLRWYLVREPDVDPERAACRRRRRVVAALAVSHRDIDQPGGVHAHRLGPAPAAHARPAVRDGHRTEADQGTARRFHATGQHAVRCGAVGVGRSGERRARPARTSPDRAVRRSTRFCNGWSGYDRARSNVTDTRACRRTTAAHCEAVLDEIERVVVGKRGALTLILTTVLAGGHVLIEDLPGLGKTLIARSFAAALGLDFTRVQFTPDLLPADLLGSTVYDMQSGRFEFRPRTDLHEPAAGRRDQPHTTQDPGGAAGGDGRGAGEHRRRHAQAARARSSCWPPTTRSSTRAPIRCPRRSSTGSRSGSNCGTCPSRTRRRCCGVASIAVPREPTVHQVVDAHDLLAMRESVEQVTVHDDVLRYVVSLAAATRQHPQVAVGASPRAELDLVQLARARALLLGRDYVIPEDVKTLAVPAMAHRISLRPGDVGAPRARRPTSSRSCCGGCRFRGPRRDRARESERDVRADRDPQHRSRVALAPIAFDARDRHLRGGGHWPSR